MNNGNNSERNNTLHKLNKIYSICLGVLICITGILFIISASHLYFTGGDAPYSRERVGRYLRTILVPIILTIAATVAGAVISFLDKVREKRVGKPSPGRTQKILARIFDTEAASGDVKDFVLKERGFRKKLSIITSSSAAALIVISCVLAILIPNHAIDGLNGHVVMSVLIITPSVLISAVGLYVEMRLATSSYEREVSLMKCEMKCNPAVKKEGYTEDVLTEKRLWIIRGSVLALGIAFVILGVFNGGMKDVFEKAVAICTECIGLG